jgi:ATP-dependent DNA ligase
MLPTVSPMLASPAEPFDSGEHVFEVKWDGVRALAAVEPGGWRLTGVDFFERVVEQGHEGVVAKHLAGRYHPGRRSTAWQKIKPAHELPCVVIGYTPARSGLDSLLVAECRAGTLRYVAELTAGFTAQAQADLSRLLACRVRRRPVVPCGKRAVWVEPELYCRVRFQQRTPNGFLRGASSVRLRKKVRQSGQ